MTDYIHYFEGGTNGTVLTSANTGTAPDTAFNTVTGGSIWTFSTTGKIRGTLGARVQISASTTWRAYDSWAQISQVAGRVGVVLNALPSAAIALCGMINGAFQTAFKVGINSSNKFVVQDNTGLVVASSASAITAGTAYYIEMQCNPGTSSSTGQVSVQVYPVSAPGTLLINYSTTTGNLGATSTTTTQGIVRGQLGNNDPVTSLDVTFDDVLWRTGTLTPVGGPSNIPPTASIDTAQTVDPYATITHSGAASTDPDGTITSYAWVQTAGPTVTLVGSSTSTVSYTAPAVTGGTSITLQLTVTDNSAGTGSATVTDSIRTPNEFAVISGALVPCRVQAVLGARPPFFGTLVADTTHTAAEAAAGVEVAMVELSWSDWEPTQGTWASTPITNAQNAVNAHVAAGRQVTLGLGLHYFPSWATSLAGGTMVDNHGNVSNKPNMIFSQAVRSAIEVYLSKVISSLGAANIWAIRIGSSTSNAGELLYPDDIAGGSYWAFDAMAQGAAGRASTVPVCPFPGWHPGTASNNGYTLTTAQAAQWAQWYVNCLVDAAQWQMNYLTAQGFSGYFEILTPGSGVRPSAWTSFVNGFIPDNSVLGVGAAWDKLYSQFTFDKHRTVIYVSSVADLSGSPADNLPVSTDNSLAITSATMDSWSAVRWQVRLGYEYGLKVSGENPGFGGTGDTHYTDTSSSGLMAKSIAFAPWLFVFYWAHDAHLYDGTIPFSTYQSYIAPLTDHNPPPDA